MDRNWKIGLSLGAALLAGGGAVIAATGKSPQPSIQRPTDDLTRSKGSSSNRYLSRYDLNGDGKVTRDELMKVANAYFIRAGATGGILTEAQFVNLRLDQVRKRSE